MTTWRFKRCIACMLVLALCLGTVAEPFATNRALADIYLPAGLTALDDEAFFGDYRLDGLLELPPKVTDLGTRVFSGTQLYAITMPESVTNIPAQGLRDVAYIRLEGVTTQADPGAFEGVRYVLGSCQSAAKDQVIADGATFVCTNTNCACKARLTEADGFYFLCEDGAATLLCAVDCTAMVGTITVPAALPDGTKVAALSPDAMIRCDGITQLRLPLGITEEAGCLDGCPNAVVTYYSDSEFYVTSLRANQSSVRPGTSVTWIARTNSTGAVAYYFEVLRQESRSLSLVSRSDGFRSSLEYEDSNCYSADLTEPGLYVAKVICRDEAGNECTASSEQVLVLSPDLSLAGIQCSHDAARVGDQITWTSVVSGGNGTVLYSYTLLQDGKSVDTVINTEVPTYTLTAAEAGQYVLTIRAMDDRIQLPTQRSETLTVYTAEAARPAAPVLTHTPLAETQSAAPVMEASNLDLIWTQVPHATQYGVTVALYDGANWREIHSATISGSKDRYTVSANLFADLAEETLCRVGLYSVNLEPGDSRYYYARLTPRQIDTSLFIDGAVSANWYEAYYASATRSFTIQSELPVIITARDGGSWYSYDLHENLLTVTMAENTTGNDVSDTLTLSNGVSSAKLVLRHYALSLAPLMVSPGGSTQAAPAHLPMDPVTLLVKSNDCTYNLYLEKQQGDGWTPVCEVEKAEDELRFCARDAGLTAGTLYRVRLVGYRNSLEDTVHRDALVSYAYLVFDATEDSVSFNGDSTHSITVPGDGEYGVTLTWSGTSPVLSSDADWLTASLLEEQDTIHITPTENTTAAARTGHITVTCGSASAVLTVMQVSNLPVLLQPEGLSTTESSPTKVYLQKKLTWNSFRAQCEQLTLSVLENGAYTQVARDTGTETCLLTVDYDTLETGVTYRLTLERGTSIHHYYLTFASNSSYIYVDDDDSLSKKLDGKGGSFTVELRTNGKWTATPSDSWLSVSATSGSSTSGKTITITAAANTTGLERRGTIVFQRGNYQQATVLVTQAPAASTLNISWDLMTTAGVTGGEEGREYLYIDTAGSWTATVTADWLAFNTSGSKKSTSGTGVDEIFVYTQELPAGSSPRTGTVTVVSGNNTRTIELTQLPVIGGQITSPVFSDDKNSPTIFEHDDLAVSWTGDVHASHYTVKVRLEDAEGQVYTRELALAADGSSSYSMTIPRDWMVPDTGYVCRLTLSGTDTAGNTTNHQRYFQVVSGDGVFLDGKVSIRESELSDLGDSTSCEVISTGTWTASASHSWITLEKASGASGETLNISVSKNYGAERDGTVTVRCGENTAVFHINQCASIPDKPLLKDCSLSLDMGSPTVLPTDTTALTVHWDKEEQPTYYQLRLYEIHSTELKQFSHVASRDDTLIAEGKNLDPRDRTYTFEGISFKPGALYMLDFYRTISDRRTGKTHYYFMLAPQGTPHVYIYDDSLAETEELDSAEDHSSFQITSNGTWRAESDADWLMVGDEGYSQAELLEMDCVPSDFNTFTAMDDRLVISALNNDSGKTRTGHVTLSIPGGKSAVITIVQPRSCTAASLISPALTDDKNDPVRLPYQDLTFRWNASPDGAGKYTLTLRERLPDETRYTEIYDKDTTGTSLTIPVSKLTQGADYIVYLDTWVDDTYTVYKSYRFHLNYENALSVTAEVRWQDDSVSVTAHASGGSGTGYKYSFVLRRNGEVDNNSLWHDAHNQYGFTFSGAGTYEMVVYVSDSLGQQDSFVVSEYIVGETAVEKYIAVNPATWTADAVGGEIPLEIVANDGWICTASTSWLHVSTDETNPTTATVTAAANPTGTARVGTVTFTCGSAKATLAVNQPAAEMVDDGSRISLSRESWDIATDLASSAALDVTATGSWVITSCPSWITLSAVSGEGDASLTLYASPNTGANRTGTLEFVCGSATVSLPVQQQGNDTLPRVTAFKMNVQTVSTGIPVSFTVSAEQADSVILMVDGTEYEQHSLVSGSVTFERSFSSDGERSVQILPVRGTTKGAPSAVQVLSVSSKGALAAPVVADVPPVLIGSDATVTWNSVPNAETYVIYLTCDGLQLWKSSVAAPQTSCTIPASVLSANGSYTCMVMATGTGYKQSQTAVFVDVRTPQVSFNIAAPTLQSVYIPTDTVDIHVDNPDGYNIAVKVTDAEGNVTYLPEDGSTVNDTFIKGKLLYTPRTTGKVILQAMAWSTEMRTTDAAAWYNESRNVTFTVNGPIARMLYLGGHSKTSTLMTTQITDLRVTTNNAVTSIRVELDNQPLTVTKDGQQLATIPTWDSEVNYNRTFTCDLPAATGGLHAYSVIASDDAGRTHRRTYTLYVVAPLTGETRYMYPAHRKVLLRSTPATKAANATTLPLSARLELLGTYKDGTLGQLYYVQYGTNKGYVRAADLSETEVLDYGAAIIKQVKPTTNFITYMTDIPLEFEWTCDLPLTGDAVFLLQKRLYPSEEDSFDHDLKWIDVATTTSTNIKVDRDLIGAGRWEFAVSIKTDGELYAWTLLPYYVFLWSTADEYLNYIQVFDNYYGYYTNAMTNIESKYNLMCNYYKMYRGGYYDTNTKKWNAPLKLDELVDSAVFKFYRGVFGDVAIPDEVACQLVVTDSILDNLAPKAEDIWISDVYDIITDLTQYTNLGTDIVETIVDALKELGKTGKTLDKLGDAMDSKVVGTIGKIDSTIDAADLTVDLFNAIILYVRYSLIDDADLQTAASGFLASSNPYLQEIGAVLLSMQDGSSCIAYALAMFGMDAAVFLKKKIGGEISDFISSLSVYGAAYMLAVKGATMFNDFAFNTTESQNAAVALTWHLDALGAYLPTYEVVWRNFKQDPRTYYASFVQASNTYLILLDAMSHALADFDDSVAGAAFYSLFNGDPELTRDAAAHTRNRTELVRDSLSTLLDLLYTDVLKPLGVPYCQLPSE